ncbi:hypothetical protein, variant [Aphanomyces invadans]|uniref:5'-3' DNA helicase ZGRF1-like N-terminal domain-containing protein n=1 Tax=Aphanomyces invadans TaxID=157072 RepID=A0A024U4I3_9STRA|nr:hypothetical protein, variant [Aphanomyces invadans]ETW01316.1 hypothetical protein, variant [Aphanomyces invadans]|eukprot:XP_008870314.1 hypothetical protein, variant [Aphanomyces invadans]
MIACLYTKHKTQKKKTYHDGHVVRSSTKITLQNDQGMTIDSMPQTDTEWTRNFPHFDFPKFLVDIDEDAYSDNHVPGTGTPHVTAPETSGSSCGRTGSNLVKYVPQRSKFQPPKRKHEIEYDAPSTSKNAADFTRTFSFNKSNITSTPSAPKVGHLTPSPTIRAPAATPQVTPPAIMSKKCRYEKNVDDAPCPEVVKNGIARVVERCAPSDIASELSNFVGCEWPDLPKPVCRTFRRLLGCPEPK